MEHVYQKRESLARVGFTLIELLVVIAIIGLLASIVLASLNSARTKSRDARRLGDLKQIQVALEFYFDSSTGNSNYPLATTGVTNCSATIQYGLEALSAAGTPFIPAVPRDPSGQTCYKYSTAQSGSRTTYHLGASLEDPTDVIKNSDKDCNDGSGTSNCPTPTNTTGFNGVDTAACQAGDRGTVCYDVIP